MRKQEKQKRKVFKTWGYCPGIVHGGSPSCYCYFCSRQRAYGEKIKNYLAMEESLAEEYSKEEQRAKALEEKKSM